MPASSGNASQISMPGTFVAIGRQGPAVAEALNQIGIADEGPTKCDQVGMSIGNRLLSNLLCIATIANEWAVEHFSKLAQCHRLPGDSFQPFASSEIVVASVMSRPAVLRWA